MIACLLIPGFELRAVLAGRDELLNRPIALEPDPARIEAEWEHLLRRLEDVGIAVEPEEPGCLYFETSHVERLYRGLEQVLERAILAVGPFWEPRLGAAAVDARRRN